MTLVLHGYCTSSNNHKWLSGVVARKVENSTGTPFLPPANEVCEGYVFTRVCHSVHGGVGGEYLGRHPPGRYTLRQVHPPQAVHPPQRYTPWAGTPPSHSACWDTVNKRLVCIPLECILVQTHFYRPQGKVMFSESSVSHSVHRGCMM